MKLQNKSILQKNKNVYLQNSKITLFNVPEIPINQEE